MRRPGLVILGAVIVVALVGGAFLAGRLTATPVRETLAEAEGTIPVFAAVESRPVDSRAAFPATVAAGDAVAVAIPGAQGGVVVRQAVTPGDTLRPGSLLGVVSGVPYFALPGPLPLFRDLRWGDTGDDVRYLQTALAKAGLEPGASGMIDWRTQNAVEQLFERSGFAVACCGSIPHQQLIAVASMPAEVLSAAAVGTTPDENNPIVEIRGGPAYVAFTADAVSASTMSVGDELLANLGGQSIQMQIESIGDFVPPSGTDPGGREIRLRPTDPDATELVAGTAVTIFGSGSSEIATAVPLVAVRQDNEGTYVLRQIADDDGEVSLERVDVDVVRSGNGWAAVAEGSVAVGDQVLVS